MKKEAVIVDSVKVKWKGPFDFTILYHKVRDWLIAEGYGDPKEELYAERVKPSGKNIEIVWSASKEEREYFMFQLKIQFFGININETEITKPDGSKMMLDNGEIEIKFSSTLLIDQKERFGSGPNPTFIQKIYETYFIPANIEKQKIELYEKTMDLIDQTKNFLNLYRF